MAVNRYYSSVAVDTTLAIGCSSSDTSITLAAVTGFPTSYPFTLALGYDTSTEELVDVTNVVGTVATVTRGVDSTTAQAHTAGAVVKHVITGRDMREAQQHIAATTSVHGITDTSTLATASSTTTFTNKTISGASNTLSNIGNGSLTNSSVTVNGSSVSLGGTVTVTAVPSGSAGGDLAGTYPNPTIKTSVSLTTPTVTGTTDVSGATLAFGTGGTITANSKTLSNADIAALSGIASAWTSYTPAITGWTLTAGTVTGAYKQIGKTVFFRGKYTMSATDTIGASNLAISLPVTAIDSTSLTGHARGGLSGIGGGTPAMVIVQASTTTFNPQILNYNPTSTTNPQYVGRSSLTTSTYNPNGNSTPASGDTIYFSGTYEAA